MASARACASVMMRLIDRRTETDREREECHQAQRRVAALRAWKRRKSATLGLIVQACGKGWRICGNTTEFLLSNDTFPKAKKLNYPCPMESFEPVCGCPTTSDGNGLHPTSDRIIEKLSQYCVTPGLLLCETVIKPLVIY